MRSIVRGGLHFRVADPDWEDPLDGAYSMSRGGRWNATGSFPVVYLNESERVSRANARRMLTDQVAGLPWTLEDLDPAALPVLVDVEVPVVRLLDARTARGLAAVGLPATYPRDRSGSVVGWDACQPIASRVWAATDWAGVGCRSAAPGMGPRDYELAWFQRPGTVIRPGRVREFGDWYG